MKGLAATHFVALGQASRSFRRRPESRFLEHQLDPGFRPEGENPGVRRDDSFQTRLALLYLEIVHDTEVAVPDLAA
ncbi:MAG: hypothetical protein JNM42_14020 [Propionivibrio sp.]|nr:hypothetical protein [Propionivibrio sp.]